MNLSDIKALYTHRQSCRAFDGKPVPEQLLKEICELALLAPSACNAQPWHLYAVTGEKVKDVAACVQGLGMNKFANDAGAFVVVTEGKSNLTARLGDRLKDQNFTPGDIGIMTAHLVLAAEAAGLASCILGWRVLSSVCPKKCASPTSSRSATRRRATLSAPRSASRRKRRSPFLSDTKRRT